jgi:predicted metalloendopeptidase
LRDFIGKKTKSPRWKDCQSAVSTRLTYSSGAMYVRKHFKLEDRDAAEEMVKHLRDAFKSMLHQNEWMNLETKEYALKKVEEMQSLIGYPNMVVNDTQLDEYYEKVILIIKIISLF